jgi:DNA-binding FadR family transcriptional regulator
VRREIASARSEKISRAIARAIVREIAEKGLKPGAQLPPEQTMADHYGVGRSSIREALRLLETQGLVLIRPGLGGGPVVNEPTPVDFGNTMTLFLQVRGTPFSHILDALPPMEGVCAALAAKRCAEEGPELFDRYVSSSALEPPARLTSDSAWMEASGAFHVGIWRLAGNDVIGLVAGAVGSIFADRARFDEHREWTLKQRRQVQAEHLEIADAIRSGDEDRARSLNSIHHERINQAVRRMYPNLASEIVDWH